MPLRRWPPGTRCCCSPNMRLSPKGRPGWTCGQTRAGCSAAAVMVAFRRRETLLQGVCAMGKLRNLSTRPQQTNLCVTQNRAADPAHDDGIAHGGSPSAASLRPLSKQLGGDVSRLSRPAIHAALHAANPPPPRRRACSMGMPRSRFPFGTFRVCACICILPRRDAHPHYLHPAGSVSRDTHACCCLLLRPSAHDSCCQHRSNRPCLLPRTPAVSEPHPGRRSITADRPGPIRPHAGALRRRFDSTSAFLSPALGHKSRRCLLQPVPAYPGWWLTASPPVVRALCASVTPTAHRPRPYLHSTLSSPL